MAVAGKELAYAQRTSGWTTTNITYGNAVANPTGGAGGKIDGLAINVAGGADPVHVEFFAPFAWHSVASKLVAVYLLIAGVVTGGQAGSSKTTTTTGGPSLYFGHRLILPAGPTLIEVGCYGESAGTSSLNAFADVPMWLAATQR